MSLTTTQTNIIPPHYATVQIHSLGQSQTKGRSEGQESLPNVGQPVLPCVSVELRNDF